MKIEDYNEYYIQGSDHYLIPKDVFKELFNEMINWREETKELNKKYENAVADYETTMFEKEQLKKQLEEKNKPQIFIDTQNIEERYAEGLYQDYLEEENKKHKTQQKEFIEYMTKTIEELECDDVDDEEMKAYLIQRINTFKEILQKYKSIIGDDK